MRVLILHQGYAFGGAERTTSNLLGALDRGVVTHTTLAAPESLRNLLPGVRCDAYVSTTSRIRHGWFISTRRLAQDVRATADILRETEPDVVVGVMHYSAALVTFGARLASSPVRTVASFRGPIYEYIRRYERGLTRLLFLRLAIGLTARLADRVLVPSQGTAQDTCRRFFASRDRIEVIPNGIDCRSVRAAAEGPTPGLGAWPSDLPLLCVAARLSIEKDVVILLDALRRLQRDEPCALVVIGDGPERVGLEKKARDWGLADRVIFVGHQRNVYPYMRRADLYVHTCQFEGFGYTMLEAMACGTPVIATDCPHGPREVLGSGEYGELVTPGDAEALMVGIRRLLREPDRRARLRARGLARAEQLSVASMVARYQAVFKELCG